MAEHVALANITVSKDRLRRVDKVKVEEIASSIQSLGRLINPIILRQEDRNKYRLVAGEHRFEAFKLLKLDAIPSVVKAADETLEGQLEDEIEEIDENIARSEMTEGEIRLATKRRKAAFVKLAAIRREAEAQAAHDAALEAEGMSRKEKDKTRKQAKRAADALGTHGFLKRPVNRKAAAEFVADTAAKHGITAKSVERRVREADEIEKVAAWAKVDARDLARSSIQSRGQLAAALVIIEEYGAAVAINDGNVHHLLKGLIRKAVNKGEQISVIDFKSRVDRELRAEELGAKRSQEESERYKHLVSLLSKAAKAVLDAQDIATAYKHPRLAERLDQIKRELRGMADGQSVGKDLTR